jgi:S-methylmethionine-dependent homocysteine/selenocysteine methylase
MHSMPKEVPRMTADKELKAIIGWLSDFSQRVFISKTCSLFAVHRDGCLFMETGNDLCDASQHDCASRSKGVNLPF